MTNFAIILCSECHEVPITIHPKLGTAKAWEKLLICDGCAERRLAAMKAKPQIPPKL